MTELKVKGLKCVRMLRELLSVNFNFICSFLDIKDNVNLQKKKSMLKSSILLYIYRAYRRRIARRIAPPDCTHAPEVGSLCHFVSISCSPSTSISLNVLRRSSLTTRCCLCYMTSYKNAQGKEKTNKD